MMKRLKRIGRVLGTLALALIVIIAAGVVYLIVGRSQSVTLPAPQGPYAVGRIITEWTDEGRPEELGGAPGQHRRLSVWIWYPAQPGGSPAAYMPADWAQAREADRGGGSLLFESIASVHPHAVADARPASQGAPFPVLIVEPGLGPLISEYTTLAEDLASRGYVVIGLNPTYSASLTILDGHVITRSDQGTIPDNATPDEAQKQGDRLVEVWAADDRFAIDEATRINSNRSNPLAGKLDVQHIGLWGHSLGGAAALEACHFDPRCTAAADLDGSPFGEVVGTGLNQPVLYIASESIPNESAALQKADQEMAAILARAPHSIRVTIQGTRHFNFTDFAAGFNPGGHLLGVLGPIDGARGLRIAGDYLGAFFDQTLKGQSSPLLEGPSRQYPEVQITSH